MLMLDACFDSFVPAPVSRMWQGRTAAAADERMTLPPRDRRRRLLRQGCDSVQYDKLQRTLIGTKPERRETELISTSVSY